MVVDCPTADIDPDDMTRNIALTDRAHYMAMQERLRVLWEMPYPLALVFEWPFYVVPRRDEKIPSRPAHLHSGII